MPVTVLKSDSCYDGPIREYFNRTDPSARRGKALIKELIEVILDVNRDRITGKISLEVNCHMGSLNDGQIGINSNRSVRLK